MLPPNTVMEVANLNLASNNVNYFIPYNRTSTTFTETEGDIYNVGVSSTVTVNFGNITTGTVLFLTTNFPVTVNLTTLTGSVSLPIIDFLYIHTSFTALTVQNLSVSNIASVNVRMLQ